MPSQPTPIPPDDLSRELAVARPDHDQSLPHIGLVGDTYTILVTGEDTAGKYTLIDMHVPPGGGPPPHRHDFQEMFTVLDGEIRVTFRGETFIARPGETINVPANARTRSPTPEIPRRGCCACARPQGRRSSSPWSASPWPAGPNRRRPWTPRHRPRSSRSPRRSPRSTRPSCCHRRPAAASGPLPAVMPAAPGDESPAGTYRGPGRNVGVRR